MPLLLADPYRYREGSVTANTECAPNTGITFYSGTKDLHAPEASQEAKEMNTASSPTPHAPVCQTSRRGWENEQRAPRPGPARGDQHDRWAYYPAAPHLLLACPQLAELAVAAQYLSCSGKTLTVGIQTRNLEPHAGDCARQDKLKKTSAELPLPGACMKQL